MAPDVAAGMLYWTDTGEYSINRARMDGTGSVELLYGGLVSPWDIELDVVVIPEPSTLTLALLGTAWMAMLVRRKRRAAPGKLDR